MSAAGRVARAVVLTPIRFYSRFVSRLLPPRCKYHPSCSSYAIGVVERYGIYRGLVLAAWRVLRCNPWSHGGYDPPEAQTLFAQPTASPPSHP